MTADKTLLGMKYADVVQAVAAKAGVSLDKALQMFYLSKEYEIISKGISDQHCMTVDYIAEDVLEDWK